MPFWSWNKTTELPPCDFVCGHCGKDITSAAGYSANSGNAYRYAYVCHRCGKLTLLEDNGTQSPGALFGNTIEDVDDAPVRNLYDEARLSFSVNAFTASVMCCRKLLMNIAVSKGAQPGKKYVEYVDFLVQKNYIPPDAREWVDYIRTLGNEANHEIDLKM